MRHPRSHGQFGDRRPSAIVVQEAKEISVIKIAEENNLADLMTTTQPPSLHRRYMRTTNVCVTAHAYASCAP